MTALMLLLALSPPITNGAVVLDRVAVVVGKGIVKTSDIERDLRVSQFLNAQALDLSNDAKRKAADRLIIQELIRLEIATGAYRTPADQDVVAFVGQIRQTRFSGSDAQMRTALAKYSLTEEALKTQLRWQLTVLSFIDQRFRPGVLVTDEDIQTYYEAHREELQKVKPGANTLEAFEPKIREIITGERVNQSFEEWLEQVRRRTRVEYRDQAFGGAAKQGASQ